MKQQILIALLTLPTSTGAQQEPFVDILREVARWTAEDHLKRPISIDPRVMSGGPGLPRALSQTHGPRLLSAFGALNQARVVSADLAARCNFPAAAECKTDGSATFVMLTDPVVDGMSAVVEVGIRSARDATPADSARIRAAYFERRKLDSVVPVPYDTTVLFKRLSGAHVDRYKVELVRDGAAWQVRRSTWMGGGG